MTTVFIISAPSGSGKSTLVSELMRLVPRLRFSVSYTTRYPRACERDGEDYFFISREEFEELARAHSNFRFWPTISRPEPGWMRRS